MEEKDKPGRPERGNLAPQDGSVTFPFIGFSKAKEHACPVHKSTPWMEP